jgi:hypothetical protein
MPLHCCSLKLVSISGIEERNAVATGRVPEPCLDAWTRLQCQKPMRVSDANGGKPSMTRASSSTNGEALALEFQWTPGDLFDIPGGGK